MAGTVTFTYDEIGPIKRIIVDWESDASGDADDVSRKISGTLIKGVTNPGAPAPTDDYDIVITDEAGLNVLGQSVDDLIDRDTATTEEVYFNIGAASSFVPVVADLLTFTISNAGNATQGQIIIYGDFQVD